MSILYAKGLAQKETNGDMTVIVSDETVDRSGESLAVKNWDLSNFNSAPRMFVDHDYRVEALTGMWKNARVEDGKLKMTPVFHEVTDIARTTKELVEKGFLNTVSVGFLMRKGAEGKTVYELLEVSWVGVPCNPNARVERLAVKDIEGNEAKAIEDFVAAFIKEMEESVPPQDAPEAAASADPVEEPKVEPTNDPAPVLEPAADPAKVDGEKGIIDDTLEAAQEMREIKYMYVDPMCNVFFSFIDAFMVASTPVENVKALCDDMCLQMQAIANQPATAPAGQGEMDDLMMMSMKNYIEQKGFTLAKKEDTSVEQKAGRVLSEKNRGIIQASLDAMTGSASAIGEATVALCELLKANEPSQGDASGGTQPEEEKSVDEGLKKELQEIATRKRVLKVAVTQLSEALSQLKQPRINH